MEIRGQREVRQKNKDCVHLYHGLLSWSLFFSWCSLTSVTTEWNHDYLNSTFGDFPTNSQMNFNISQQTELDPHKQSHGPQSELNPLTPKLIFLIISLLPLCTLRQSKNA